MSISAYFPATASMPAETISYSYGANGRTESVSDNRGSTSLAYEAGSDRVKSVADPVTGAISYTYGVLGERRSLALPGGGTWTYGYAEYGPPLQMLPKDDPNSAGLPLTSLTDEAGRRVNYQLDEMGQLIWVQFNQVFSGSTLMSYCRTDYTYQVVNLLSFRPQLMEIKNSFNVQVQGSWQTSVLMQNDYTYDTAGQRLSNQITSSGGSSRTESYGYDDLNRLSSVSYGDGQTQSYSIDAMGNRLSKTDVGGGINGTEGYAYNAANMLLSRGATSYSNDANGNTLTGGGRTNTWDSENRLVQSVVGANTCVYTYGGDGLRRRAAITTGGTTTSTDYVLDKDILVRERRNSANYATYLVGPRGPEYRRDDTTNPATARWYLYDGTGNVVGEVDSSGNITSSRKLDVYGSVRGGNNPSGTSSHKFQGKYGLFSDDATGLVYVRARYYDPLTGGFISEDAARAGRNWFVYCGSNPLNYHDPSGHFTLIDLLWGDMNSEDVEAAEAKMAEHFADWGENKIAQAECVKGFETKRSTFFV